MITPEQLAEWRALANAATPGPWTASPRSSDGHVGWFLGAEINELEQPERGQFTSLDDAAFVAAARRAVPALLDEVERQRVEIETLHSLFVLLTRAEGDPKPSLSPVPDVGLVPETLDCVTAQQWLMMGFSTLSGDDALDRAVQRTANADGLHFEKMHYEGIARGTRQNNCLCTHSRAGNNLALVTPRTELRPMFVTTEDGREMSVLAGVCEGGVLHYAQVKP